MTTLPSSARSLSAGLVLVSLFAFLCVAGGACRLLPGASPPGAPGDELAQLGQLVDSAEGGVMMARLGCGALASQADRQACDGSLDALEAGLQVAAGAVAAGQSCQARQDATCRAAALATARTEIPRVRGLVAQLHAPEPSSSSAPEASSAPAAAASAP